MEEIEQKINNLSINETNDKKTDLSILHIDKVEKVDDTLNEKHIELKIKLKHILDSSNDNHKLKIMLCDNIKDSCIYCKIYSLSGQVSGPLIEYYIKNKHNMTKNKSSDCIGDLSKNDENIEIKVSMGGKEHNKFNYVQIRVNHKCIYILIAYYISYDNLNEFGELFIFKINKNDMINILFKHGCYAHGTVNKLGKINEIDLKNESNDKEYAIRPKYNDKCWNDLLNFRINEIDI